VAERVGFIVANEAGRGAIDRAVAAKVTRNEMAVLLAVLHVTVLWSRLSDHQSLAQLARVAGITGKYQRDVDKRVADALRHLAKLGVITYQPGRGKSISKVGLPHFQTGSDHTPSEGVESDPQRGSIHTPQGGQFTPPTQGLPQGSQYTRGRRGRPSFDGSAWADQPGGVTQL
jgi:hypothetical protein